MDADTQVWTGPDGFETASAQFVGRWNRLISTTNWEKGRIISQWRMKLMAEGAPSWAYSDEEWSRRVGNVSGQHVGRLRRVFEHFGEVYEQYTGLYWSHFLAALDWPDAEMWLEGSVQNDWSVAQMRNQRWEALGAPADRKPRDEDIFAAELDEDVAAGDDIGGASSETRSSSVGIVRDPDAEPAATEDTGLDDLVEMFPADAAEADIRPTAPTANPFEDLADLPEDLADAVDGLKVAILNHKLSGWRDVSCNEVLRVLEALKQLALREGQ